MSTRRANRGTWRLWQAWQSAAVMWMLLTTTATLDVFGAEITFSPPAMLGSQVERTSLTERSFATDGAGNWLAAWGSRDDLGGLVGTDSDIVATTSSDDGETWSVPCPLHASATTDTGDDWTVSVACGNGTYVAVWTSLADLGLGIREDADILCSRLPSGATEWSFPAPVNANASTDVSKNGKVLTCEDRWPQVATDGNGTWVAVWERNGQDPGTVVAAVSADDGQTWGGDIVISSNRFENEFSITYGNGTWVIVSASPLEPSGVFAYTSQDGITWSSGMQISSQYLAEDPVVATDRQGNWIAAWEANVKSTIPVLKHVYSSTSSDGAETWSPYERLVADDALAGEEWMPSVAVDDAGNWIVALTAYGSHGGLFGSDGSLLAYRSSDLGSTWKGPIVIGPTQAPNGECAVGYPVLCAGVPGNWLAAWIERSFVDDDVSINLATASFPPPVGTPGISLSPDYDVLTSEDGTSDLLWVRLDTAPLPGEEVRIHVATDDPSEATVATTMPLAFTTADWMAEKPVMLTGVEDSGEADGGTPFTVTIGPAESTLAESSYTGLYAPPVYGLNLDNDVAETVHVASVDYALVKRERDLEVQVHVSDNLGAAVEGADVGIRIYLDGTLVYGERELTDGGGAASFLLRNAPSGNYITEVWFLEAAGLIWDGTTPSNSFTR